MQKNPNLLTLIRFGLKNIWEFLIIGSFLARTISATFPVLLSSDVLFRYLKRKVQTAPEPTARGSINSSSPDDT